MLYNVGIIQMQYKIVKKELLMVKEDARILKVRYENICAEDEYNHVIKRIVIPKRFKKKTSIVIDKELSRDPLLSDTFIEDLEILEKVSRYGKELYR